VNPLRRHRGLTLLEVVLAITLVVGLMAGLFAFSRRTMDVRGELADDARRLAADRIVLDRLTAELRAANASRFLRLGLGGSSRQVQFVTSAVPGPAVWVRPEAMEQPPAREHDLRLVGYRLRVATDERGEVLRDENGCAIIEGLERSSRKVLAAPAVQEGERLDETPPVRRLLLAPHCKFLHLRYWTGDAWIGSWRGGDLPAAVEIHLGAVPCPEGMAVDDYLAAYPTRRRVVYLPAGARPKAGAIRRRGAAGTSFGGGRP
jgi:hypothetical protein